MRVAAAEARRVLVEMAADKLAVPRPTIDGDGWRRASQRAMPARRSSYAELIGGHYFNVQLDWNGKYGNPLYAPGKAQPKDPKDHKIVGQPIKREDIAPKVFAQADFCTDIKVPGMVHGRMIRPRRRRRRAGESRREPRSPDIPRRQGRLEQRLPRRRRRQGMGRHPGRRAQLKVEWSQTAPPFPPQATLYDHIRKSPVRKREVEGKHPAMSTTPSNPPPR